MKSFEVITLADRATGGRARILPALGFNCYSFEAAIDGQPVELLWAAPQFATGTQKPSRGGIPILFPFAGRIRGTEFQFQHEHYRLPAGDDFGNAIHGFVLSRAWRVVEQRQDLVTGEFLASRDDPALLRHWPADFRIRVTYQLARNELRCQVEADNPDNRPLPFWFGTHPYFRLPLVAGSQANQCRIRVPAAAYWELENLLPTGRRLPVKGHRDLRGGANFENLVLDDILTDLEHPSGECKAMLDDPAARRRLTVAFGQEFQACVVFTPPHREAVCIEPYTSVSDAFALEARGIKTGMRVLAPGECFRARIAMTIE
jgi:aldose 1-epimerase